MEWPSWFCETDRKAVAGRDGGPPWKGTGLNVAVLVGPAAEQPGGGDVERPDRHVAAGRGRADGKPGRVSIRAVAAPVEPPVRVEDHQPAHEHDDERDGIYPMPCSRDGPVTIYQPPPAVGR